MVLIISQPNDLSTVHIIDWINNSDVLFCRVNSTDKFASRSLKFGKNQKIEWTIELRGRSFNIDDITSIWIRRGEFNLVNVYEQENMTESLDRGIRHHLQNEMDSLEGSMHFLVESHRCLGRAASHIDKLTVLLCARNRGIDIPQTLVTSDDTEIENWLAEGQRIITKSISNNFVKLSEDNSEEVKSWITYTEEITGFNKDQNQRRFPSLIQEKLDKDFELRIFFLGGEFYSMAIFSQLDEQTSTDFRRYNHKNPNRMVPFDLPEEISAKLKSLMEKLDLNTGSIDMVVTRDKRFVFLEVNPMGQFGMVSMPCNYNLEKKIAQFLTCK